MTVTKEELDRFHQYAVQKVNNGVEVNSLTQLVEEWHEKNERAEVNQAIRDGLADIEAGNYRALNEFMDEFRKKYNIPEDA